MRNQKFSKDVNRNCEFYSSKKRTKRAKKEPQEQLMSVPGIDELLREERVCDVIFPRIQKSHVLEKKLVILS